MALGDGIRRNIATVSPDERRRLRDAFLALNKRFYGGDPQDMQFGRHVPGGVSVWFKQDEIHARTGVHNSPAFLTWHRELCSRLEAHLRSVDPELSLHYWDWTTDPRNQEAPDGTVFSLFTEDFMGAANGLIGEPWLTAGFYNPNIDPSDPNGPPGRDTDPDDPDPHEDPGYNAAFPPRTVRRNAPPTRPPVSPERDKAGTNAASYPEMRKILENNHGRAHVWFPSPSKLFNGHVSFRDPFVFLLHSNVDRLFALWQLQPGHPERLDPLTVYGSDGTLEAVYELDVTTIDGHNFVDEPDEVEWGILTPLLPWSGFEFEALDSSGNKRTLAVTPLHPWTEPENEHVGRQKNSKDPSVVRPPKYDTNP